MACLFGHKWNGCKCYKCGKVRDEQHKWNGCKCENCDKSRDEGHEWDKTRKNIWTCKNCAQTVNIDEVYKPFFSFMASCQLVGQLEEGFNLLTELKKWFEDTQPKAVDTLYNNLLRIYSNDDRRNSKITEYMKPFINVEFLKFYLTKHGTYMLEELKGIIKTDDVIAACTGFDEGKKQDIYKTLKIADGSIIKSNCEIDKHELEYIKTIRTKPSQTADSADVGIEVKVYKCKVCGYKEGIMPSGVKYHGSLE